MRRRRWALYLITLLVVLFTGLALGSFLEESMLTERVRELQEENERLQRWLEGNITAYKGGLEINVLGVYFSPRGGCAKAIIDLIGSANKSIHVLIYSFTLDFIGDALIEAYRRGVDVKVVFEEEQISEYSEYWRLRDAGVLVRNDTNPRAMHNKVMIVDSEIVVTGSYNWSKSAEEDNDENIIIIRSKSIAEKYERIFGEIWTKGI
ncbi:MAG: phospholipase D family protein [Candidatus Bathyarchaeia archaeon]